MNKDDIEKSLARIAYVKKSKGNLYDNHIKHECSTKFCDPCSEYICIQRKQLVGPIVCKDVYLCNYNVVHICTVDTCNTIDHGVCRISGACYGASGVSSYDKLDYRTWRTKTTDYSRTSQPGRIYGQEKEEEEKEPVKYKKPKRIYKVSHKALETTIRNIVKTLLYDKCRTVINTARLKKANSEYLNTINAYKLQCAIDNIPINMIQLILIKQKHDCIDVEQLPVESYNLDKIQHYVFLCKQVCIFVQHYWQKKISFVSVTLAVLYAMKYGYRLHDIEILPQDLYLTHMLPMINDLPQFNIAKKMLTHGQDILDRAYLDAIDRNVPLSEFKLDFIQKELNGEQMCTMRPANYRKRKV